MSLDTGDKIETTLRRQIFKLERINAALMTQVERVTDQHEGAYSLFQTAIMLERRVRTRTEELTTLMNELERSNSALKAAKDEAEQANRSKTRFLAAASHDLLQPLNAARLSISALVDAPPDDEAGVIAGQVDRGLQTIENIIKTLLDISKLDAGVVYPVLESVALPDVFADLAQSFGPGAEMKGLRLSVRCRSDLCVETDAGLLKRVVQNLVANAVRYTHRGGVLIAARERHGECVIDVVDSGIGIPAHEQAFIFDEFYRGRQPNGTADVGLGLGLAIVRRMADMLGHTLEHWSRVGHGSRFRLRLPIARGAARAAEAPSHPHSFAGTRVVLIDTDKAAREALSRLLAGWGFEVHALDDPADLLEGRRALHPSVAILLVDQHLGRDMLGTDVVPRLRAMLRREIPAVIVTADLSGTMEAEVAAISCEIALKPVKPAHLRSLLSHLLRAKDLPRVPDKPGAW